VGLVVGPVAVVLHKREAFGNRSRLFLLSVKTGCSGDRPFLRPSWANGMDLPPVTGRAFGPVNGYDCGRAPAVWNLAYAAGEGLWWSWSAALAAAVFLLPQWFPPSVADPIHPLTVQQFEERHRVAYDAYAARDDSSAYDLLAQTFSGRELERQFLAFARGKDQTRKARANVMVWDVLYQDVRTLGGSDDRLRVYAKWNVVFVLGHRKHSHVRSNAYEALFDLRWADGEWRIVNSRMLSDTRTG